MMKMQVQERKRIVNARANEIKNFVLSLFKDDKTVDISIVRSSMNKATDLINQEVQERRANKLLDDIYNS